MSEAPIIALARGIICQAIEAGASGVQIEPGADRMESYFLIDGTLQRVPHLSLRASIQPALVRCYKVLANTSWASRDRPHKGNIGVSYDGTHYDIDLVFPATGLGEKIVISISAGSDPRPDDFVISGPDRPI